MKRELWTLNSYLVLREDLYQRNTFQVYKKVLNPFLEVVLLLGTQFLE